MGKLKLMQAAYEASSETCMAFKSRKTSTPSVAAFQRLQLTNVTLPDFSNCRSAEFELSGVTMKPC